MSLHLKYIYLLFLCSSITIWAQSTKPDKTDSVTTQQLENVIVTGVRNERPIKLSPTTIQVLGGKALVDAGYSDLQHALQQETPGMNIQKEGFGNELSMQGLDARHGLFLQDG